MKSKQESDTVDLMKKSKRSIHELGMKYKAKDIVKTVDDVPFLHNTDLDTRTTGEKFSFKFSKKQM